ncbi:MAG: EAL domain-containing protein [Alkalibacterium sp.]|nr:EAL domain-containing protein [Alkalibacterium sp.]
MACPSCTISKQRIILDIPSKLTSMVLSHFDQRDYPYAIKDDYILTTEQAAADLTDFLEAMALTEEVSFKIHNDEWLPILDIRTYIESSWVDNILREKFIAMHFQPIITSTGKIYGYEMLARFKDQNGDVIYPDVMFPAAKIRGRTFALDRLCRIQGVRQVTRLSEDQKAFINFIPTAIYDPAYCLKTTTAVAKQMNIESDRFVFEVVETEKIRDTAHLKSILTYYQNNGFSYALDDVGSGYNTLDLLSDLKPPYVKLDMHYVQGVHASEKKQAVALSFLEKAREYGAITLAEGIEEIEDFEWLKTNGYHLFQGYLFGKPLPDPLPENAVDLTRY